MKTTVAPGTRRLGQEVGGGGTFQGQTGSDTGLGMENGG